MPRNTPKFNIADIYESVELEAFDIYGTPIILVRFVFPEGFKHIHLTRDKSIPYTTYTLDAVVDKIESISKTLPIHFIADDPVLCGVQSIVDRLQLKPPSHYRVVYLNTSGFFPINSGYFSGVYLNTRPGLRPQPQLVNGAREIRAYWNPEDPTFEDHMSLIEEMCQDKNRLFLVPYNIDQKTIDSTLRQCLKSGWRFGLHMASAMPNVDSSLTTNPEAEKVYHQRYHETLSQKKSR